MDCILLWPCGTVPVGDFLGGLLEVRILREHGFVTVGARSGIVVGRCAEEFGIVALVADGFDPLLGTECRTLGIVGNELRLGQAFLVDFSVDEDDRNACGNSLLHRTDRTVGVGRVEDDRDRLVGDRRVDQVAFGIGVTLVRTDRCRVAKLFGCRLGNVALRQPVGFDGSLTMIVIMPAAQAELARSGATAAAAKRMRMPLLNIVSLPLVSLVVTGESGGAFPNRLFRNPGCRRG
jgi:hypothetical protein